MSRHVVRVRPAARRDIAELISWFRENADSEVAIRFAASATMTFRKLASEPGLGSPVETKVPDLLETRKWSVEGFPKIRVFYRPSRDGVSIIRVLHAAQDWRRS